MSWTTFFFPAVGTTGFGRFTPSCSQRTPFDNPKRCIRPGGKCSTCSGRLSLPFSFRRHAHGLGSNGMHRSFAQVVSSSFVFFFFLHLSSGSFLRRLVSVGFFGFLFRTTGVGRGVVFRTRCSIDTVWIPNHGCDAWMMVSSFFLRSLWVPLPPLGWVDPTQWTWERTEGRAAFSFPFVGYDRSIDRSIESFHPLLSLGSGNPLSYIVPVPSPTLERTWVHPHTPSTSACGWDPFVRPPSPPTIPLWSWSIRSSLPHTQGPTSTTGRRTRRETRNQPKRETIAHLRSHLRVRKRRGGTVPTRWNHVGEKAHEPRSSVLRKQTQKTGAEPP